MNTGWFGAHELNRWLWLLVFFPAAPLIAQTIDVELHASGAPDPVVQGSNFTFTITVENHGPDDLDEGTAQFFSLYHPPASVYFTDPQFAGPGGFDGFEDAYWYPGPLLAGQSHTLTISGAMLAQGDQTVELYAHMPTGVDPNMTNNTNSVSLHVEPRVDLVLAFAPDTGPLMVNQAFQYGVLLTNRGPGTAENIVVEQVVPEGFVVLDLSYVHGTASNDNGVIIWQMDWSGGEHALWVDVRSSATGVFTNTASVTNDYVDVDLSNNTASWVFTIHDDPPADLEVVKGVVDDLTEAGVGEPFWYHLLVINHGPGTAVNAMMTDTLPDGITVNWDEEEIGERNITLDGRTITWNLGAAFEAGWEDNFWLEAWADEPGVYTNRAVLAADTADPDETNNGAEHVMTVTPPFVDVGIEVNLYPNPASPESPVDIVIDVHNHGSVDVEGVVVTNRLPPGAVFKEVDAESPVVDWSRDGNTVTLQFGTIPVHEQRWAQIAIDAPLYGASTNLATVSTISGDANPANDTSEVVLALDDDADVGVGMDPTPAFFPFGTPVTYRIWVTNAGPASAAGVRCEITLPQPAELDDVQVSAGTWTNTTEQVTWDVGLLEGEYTHFIDLTVVHTANGYPTNIATVSTLSTDPNPGNNLYMDITEVTGAPDLILTPVAATNAVWASHYLEARVTTNGWGAEGVAIDFEVWRGPMTGQATNVVTDTLGIARFMYVNDNMPGLDRISAAGELAGKSLAAGATARWIYMDTQLFLTNGLHVVINDCVDVPLVIEPNIRIDELRVYMHIAHAWAEDLAVSLVAPDESVQLLFSELAGATNGIGFGTRGNPPDFVLDDEDGDDLGGGVEPYVGHFRTPDGVLSNYFGMETRGTWYLRVCDLWQEEEPGIVYAWGLGIEPLDDDLNNDGISDTWQAEHWPEFDPDAEGPNPWDPDVDANNNGTPNKTAFLTGFSPTDPASSGFGFIRGPIRAWEFPVIEWASSSNRYYSLYRATNLMDGFTLLQDGIPAVPPLNVHTDVTAVGRALFYAVEQEE